MIALASAVDADLLRLRHEFLLMPALCLTVAQVARLLGIRTDDAAAIVTILQEDGWLIRTPAGLYRRPEPLLT